MDSFRGYLLEGVRKPLLAIVLLASLVACERSIPRAGMVTPENAEFVVPKGDVAAGRPGDFFLRNELATFIIQRPGRELALGPYGGNVIDVALAGGVDRFGELIPALAIGRTIRADHIEVIHDGSGGKPAIVEVRGVDATNDYYNVVGVDPTIFLDLGLLLRDPNKTMELDVRTRYILPDDEARLTIQYTFTNRAPSKQTVPMGFLIDARGNLAGFQLISGFEPEISQATSLTNIGDFLNMEAQTPLQGLFGPDISLAIVPRRIGDTTDFPVIATQIPSLGSIVVLNAATVLDVASQGAFILEPQESIEVEVDLLAAATPQEVLARARDLLGTPQARVHGCVTAGGEPLQESVRVGIMGLNGDIQGFFHTATDGCFDSKLPPGTYRAIAGRAYRHPSAEVVVEVPGELHLDLPQLGRVEFAVDIYNDLDSPQPGRHPCRLSIFGDLALVRHPALLDLGRDDPGNDPYRFEFSRYCQGSIELPAGRHLVMFTRGPEFDTYEALVDVHPGETVQISGQLHRVVDSQGYAASDFHIHSIYSSDSAVAPHDRVLTIAAEGLDFWASTEHDVVVDYTRHIAELDLQNELFTMPGSEVTTFDTGHFGVYPLPVNENFFNGGSPDWALGADGYRMTMGELFAKFRAEGALIQVNHPRNTGIALGAYFTRSGLRYDPHTRQPYADPNLQPLANRHLRHRPGTIFFSDDFDIIEVTNGLSTHVHNQMVYEQRMEVAGKDWFNFLSAGRKIVGVANSDTHNLRRLPGSPRTMVGNFHGQNVSKVLAGLAHGDVVMTTGPMLRAWIEDENGEVGSLGDLFAPSSSQVVLHIHAESPTWLPLNRFEVLVNNWFDDPANAPRSAGIVGPADLEGTEVTRANGGQAYIYRTEIELDLEQAPFTEGDSWVIVRVGGTQSAMFTYLGSRATINLDGESPETFLTQRIGRPAYAVTNPVFLDLDGNGIWSP